MGKLSRNYNRKARQVSALVDTTTARKKNEELSKLIGLGTSQSEYTLDHDTSNALVTSSNVTKKRSSDLEPSKNRKHKILTKKQKKKLEYLQARRRKEKKRGDILKSLAEHQLPQEELSLYKSTTSIGQVDRKRKLEHGSIKLGTNNDDVDSLDVDARTKSKFSCKKKKELNYTNTVADDGIPLPCLDLNSFDNECIDDDDDDSSSSDEDDKVANEEDEGGKIKGVNEEEEVAYVVADNVCNVADSSHKRGNDTDADACMTEIFENMPKQGMSVISKNGCMKPIYVDLDRNEEIQAARLLLPILAEEQIIMETIQENDVIIICGSTGSGKTTQLPQFLYEAGYATHESRCGIIGITEPRRVAAISMSKRVAEEMNLSTEKVSYQIRFEGNTTKETKIKFMTEGILLKEMETDFLLTKYSAIVIDEAHERTVYTDILIGMLTRIVPLRKKRDNTLKLIIMSATLRIEDFTDNQRLFPKPPPVIKVDSRQYPVTIHFNRKTQDDYFTEAFRKVCKIHQSFKPDGGILVFLTGQREVLSLCSKLAKMFPKRACSKIHEGNETKIDLDKYSLPQDIVEVISEDVDHVDTCDSSDEECNLGDEVKNFIPNSMDYAPLHILPLYSLLPTKEQSKVFSEIPEGHRLCVVSTNVAETSLTIPGIKYVIDSGKMKSKFFDKVTGVSKFLITWSSKASANQRAGRAGRVGPGHCYRLYSSAVYENSFDEFSEPEIRQRPVEDLVLQMKYMHIDKVVNFPFPSSPDPVALESAEKLLIDLGALRNTKTKSSHELATITPLGKHLAKIPLSPRFAKMIYIAAKKACIQYMIVIAAALAVKDIFTNDIDLSVVDIDNEDNEKKKTLITRARRKWCGEGPSADLGDLMIILRAIGASEHSSCFEKFCESSGLRVKALTEIRKLRIQIIKSLNQVLNDPISVDLKITPPSNEDAVMIRQIILSCMGNHVARKLPPEQSKSLKLKHAYQCCSTEDFVYIHPTSALFTKLPEYVVYHEIIETRKLYMKTLFCINEDWLPLHVPYRCHLGKVLAVPTPSFNENEGNVQCYMNCTFGAHMWPLSQQMLPYPDCTDKYRWFIKFFLDGVVCEKLKQFSSFLLTPSSVMVKSWSHLQQKTEDLLCCFMEKEISNKHTLLGKWKNDPTYILSHYLKWLPDSQHHIVKLMWPPTE